jgi:hypothetical protein
VPFVALVVPKKNYALYENIFTCKSAKIPLTCQVIPVDFVRIVSKEWKPAKNEWQ